MAPDPGKRLGVGRWREQNLLILGKNQFPIELLDPGGRGDLRTFEPQRSLGSTVGEAVAHFEQVLAAQTRG